MMIVIKKNDNDDGRKIKNDGKMTMMIIIIKKQ
jgi:hypothetical protein